MPGRSPTHTIVPSVSSRGRAASSNSDGAAAIIVVFAPLAAFAATESLGKGFLDHGVATPISNHRGVVATVDGEGRNVVLAWLFDRRGGYALLMIDAETGKSEEFRVPFSPGGDCPYASILSGRNRYYSHYNRHFVEFDPEKRAFTFHRKTAPKMAPSRQKAAVGR